MNSQPQRVSTRFEVRVIPRAPREEFGGTRGSALVVRVTAAPVDGAANEALVKMLSDTLGVPASDLAIISGHHSRDKTLRVVGLTASQLRQRLRKAGAL